MTYLNIKIIEMLYAIVNLYDQNRKGDKNDFLLQQQIRVYENLPQGRKRARYARHKKWTCLQI